MDAGSAARAAVAALVVVAATVAAGLDVIGGEALVGTYGTVLGYVFRASVEAAGSSRGRGRGAE